MINFLLDEALNFHAKLNTAAGIRDIGLIESAVNSPFQTFGGEDLYPTIFDKAAQLFYALTKNHGFIDGNKRVALHITAVFLHVNNFKLNCPKNELVKISLDVAAGNISADDLKFWLLRRATGNLIFSGNITVSN